MAAHPFPRKLRGEVELDLCFPCQGIWFDEHESPQLAPAGVVALFRLIHEHDAVHRQPLTAHLRCPRCREGLIRSQDRVRSGLFNYHRCGQQHGRFISFGQFMIEKGFVRQLHKPEIERLAASVGTVRCNGCGAPVDIRREDACPHCRAAVAILDPAAVEQALAGYQRAAMQASAPADPTALADAILAGERARSAARRERNGGVLDKDIADLLLDGIGMLWRIAS